MEDGIKSEGSESQDVGENSLKAVPASTPLSGTKLEAQEFDVEEPSHSESVKPIDAGEIEIWSRIRTEAIRWYIVRRVMSLYTAWVLLGLIIFAATRNIWLLGSMGILALPLGIILNYYFRSSRKE